MQRLGEKMLGEKTNVQRVYGSTVRNFEKLIVANAAAMAGMCTIVFAPVGLAMVLGAVEAAFVGPERAVEWAALTRGVKRYTGKAAKIWAVSLVALAAGVAAVVFYGQVLEGEGLLWMAGFMLVFYALVGLVLMFALSQAVVDRLRKEGRIKGVRVGLIEGFAEHSRHVIAAAAIGAVLALTMAGFVALGVALPALYLVEATGRLDA
ncbi:MAG: hypothetical protein JW909_03255 [Planctomycetes bacterium]|nr:hypothetical protein [Planctomycetota bacterium]